MLYLSVNKTQIKLLFFKKTLLGQYEVSFYDKKHQVDLLENGKTPKTDILASAVKEAFTSISATQLKEKEICLSLPQEVFHFLRVEVPKDMTGTAITPFIKDKARAQLGLDIDNCAFDYILQDNDNQKYILFFAIERDLLKQYQEVFNLLNLSITAIVPEVLSYFKLFDKTLRKDKKEFIFYVSYEKNQASGYLFDSYGPLEEPQWIQTSVDENNIEETLKQKATEFETSGKKLNRLILSGESSDAIRQDTFTKNVGVWTNPLKRIIPNFYQDYIKLLVMPNNQPLPFLAYDVCIGTFIFTLENKSFSFFKKRPGDSPKRAFAKPSIKLPWKPILLFTASFMLSFIVLMLISKINFGGMKLGSGQAKQTPTPTTAAKAVTELPTPTPTKVPQIDRSKIKVKILNGSGIAGKASDVKAVLTNVGYEQILTGNADNFDYTATEIQVKKGNEAVGNLVKDDLKKNTTTAKVTTLDDSAASDVIIIIGTDFK